MATSRQRNWWKIAFFVSLVAFELAREFAVLSTSSRAYPSVTERVFRSGEYTNVEGRWLRTDGGEALVPQAIRIDCYASKLEYYEAGYQINGQSVSSVGFEIHAAEFTEGSISFVNSAA